MTPETVLEDTAEALDTARHIGLYRGHLCFWKGKLQALHRQHTTKQHPVFFNFGPKDLIDGFNCNEWENLKTKLWNFFKEKR